MGSLQRHGALGLALACTLAGCATVSQSPMQTIAVRTVLDHREVGGVGCVLTNDAGRWFVVAPGRVSVRRSAGNLFVDCKKTTDGASIAGQDRFASRATNKATIGNAVTTAGLGYLLDKQTGAGWDYPDTVTVLLKGGPKAVRKDAQQDQEQEASGATVY